jgi:AraC family transcriptional regulator
MHHTNHDKALGLAVKKVLEYIQLNLSEDLSLEILAGVANYSPFHFQRLFTEQVGETPKQYIIRLRLERMAHFLKLFPEMSISDLSLESGFASLSTFSRAFKNYFGISADEYKNLPATQYRKISKANSKKSKTSAVFSPDICARDFSKEEIMDWIKKVNITTKRQQGYKIIYTSTCLKTNDAISLAFRELCRWAEPRGLLTSETRFTGLLLDVPFITPMEKCRYWAGISVPQHIQLPGESSITEVPDGLYATYSMKGNLLAMVKSLVFFSHGWLNESGYAIKSINGFEVFSENPADKPSETIIREIMIPVCPV